MKEKTFFLSLNHRNEKSIGSNYRSALNPICQIKVETLENKLLFFFYMHAHTFQTRRATAQHGKHKNTTSETTHTSVL